MKDFYAGILIQSLVDIRTKIENNKGINYTSSAAKNGVVFNSIKISDRYITGECVCTSNFGIISSTTLFKLWCSEKSKEKDNDGKSWNVFKFNEIEKMAFYEDVNDGKKKYLVKYINHKS